MLNISRQGSTAAACRPLRRLVEHFFSLSMSIRPVRAKIEAGWPDFEPKRDPMLRLFLGDSVGNLSMTLGRCPYFVTAYDPVSRFANKPSVMLLVTLKIDPGFVFS